MVRLYSKLRALRSDVPPAFTHTTQVGNAPGWRITSRRGWHVLQRAAMAGRHQLPAVVRQDGQLFILLAVAKELAPNAVAYRRTPDRTIGRKGYIEVTRELAQAVLDHPSYFEDGFCRATSAHTIHDGLDIGLWLLEQLGVPVEGGWEAVVRGWEGGAS